MRRRIYRGALGYGWMDWNGDGTFQGQTCPGFLVQENLTDGIDINEDRFCIDEGEDEILDSEPAGDDVVEDGKIADGPDRTCETDGQGDDKKLREPGHEQERYLVGAEDWSELDLSFNNPHREISVSPDPDELYEVLGAMAETIGPDIEVEAVGVASVVDGVAEVEVTVRNVGGGPARDVLIVGEAMVWSMTTELVMANSGVTRTMAIRVPWDVCTGTGSASLSITSTDLFGQPGHQLQQLDFAHDYDLCLVNPE